MRNGGKYVSVFLKELDVTHRNLWEVGLSPLNPGPFYDIVLVQRAALVSSQSFFEAASLMTQISHKHLIRTHGVSVHGVKSKMKQ